MPGLQGCRGSDHCQRDAYNHGWDRQQVVALTIAGSTDANRTFTSAELLNAEQLCVRTFVGGAWPGRGRG